MSRSRLSSSGGEKSKSHTSTKNNKKSTIIESCNFNNHEQYDLLTNVFFKTQNIFVGKEHDGFKDNIKKLIKNNKSPPPPIMSELLLYKEILYDNGEFETLWYESSRHIKYCQVVEGEGTRLSKPFITLMNIQSLFQIRNCFKKGVILLDSTINNYKDLIDNVTNICQQRNIINDDEVIMLHSIFNAPKYHFVNNKLRFIENDSRYSGNNETKFIDSSDDDNNDDDDEYNSQSIQQQLDEVIPLKKENEEDDRFMLKLQPNTESSIIMCGVVQKLKQPMCTFIRLATKTLFYPEMPSHPVPTRFIFILLVPNENYTHEILYLGRTLSALLADDIFKSIIYNCSCNITICEAIDKFMSQIIAIAPRQLNIHNTRLDPIDDICIENRNITNRYIDYDGIEILENNKNYTNRTGNSFDYELARTGKVFGGLINDIKKKSSTYFSDFSDFFKGRPGQSLASIFFLFFASLTSALTFGAVMEIALNREMAAIENILASVICGVFFGLFSGQPLNILTATGPTLAFETIIFSFCKANNWDFLPFRFWVGLSIAIYLTIFIAFDLCSLVSLITRYTEEAFTVLIAIVFILQALKELIEIGHSYPIQKNIHEIFESPCLCNLTGTVLNNKLRKVKNFDPSSCLAIGGTPHGLMCDYKPDIFLFSIILTSITVIIAYLLTAFRHSNFFSSKIRQSLADFNIVIAIAVTTILAIIVGLDVPTLKIPVTFKPTKDRSWIINPLIFDSYHAYLYAAFLGICYSILIMLDQQITSAIINKKDHLLRKGHGYHLDLIIVVILIIICATFGLPFYVANTVISLMHVESLKIYSECNAPGEKPQLLGIKEQRLTAIIAHIIIGFSVSLTAIIKFVPLPVLIGVFLYMGIISLSSLQFVQRLRLFFIPIKHQPDLPWLRIMPMYRVHLFTVTQIVCLTGLFMVKYNKTTSMIFPLMIVLIIIIRLTILKILFKERELLSLDGKPPTLKEILKPKTIIEIIEEKMNYGMMRRVERKDSLAMSNKFNQISNSNLSEKKINSHLYTMDPSSISEKNIYELSNTTSDDVIQNANSLNNISKSHFLGQSNA
ncbi:Na[+]-driven anion exchanger 1 [Strongyloides ratti]|uniref:Anion exchange protein n=1 Tax=Strongyloides ratti TaxID=34506 RepID=A0A090KUU0_STRRB|nr:Na[+]-driven anion exchanger 1 [Strongyloides ratti]CEF61171.1 Na[+]-driven anion exchanger 1 [Strongyloides ratti]